jgi:AraC family transcriptional regulator of adaptative response/methylated-DNA-[protein]-cysteine methyltransferase
MAPTWDTDEKRWTAVVRRDRGADGAFYYSVRTTGVYCRPSCGSRLARRANVRFHPTREEAERAGLRPCRRCRPSEPPLVERQAAAVARACRLIETADGVPSLDALAGAAGMSRFHFHRVFRAITGVTPKAYAVAHRARRVRDALSRSETVTDAIYGAGFGSSGRFYASAWEVLGLTPTDFRAGGSGATIRFAVGQSSLGAILVAATDKGVCAILLGDDPEVLVHDLQDRFPRARLIGGDRGFERLVATVVDSADRRRARRAGGWDLRRRGLPRPGGARLRRAGVGHREVARAPPRPTAGGGGTGVRAPTRSRCRGEPPSRRSCRCSDGGGHGQGPRRRAG